MLSKLSTREQDMLLLGVAASVLFILIRFILFPTLDKRESLANQLNAKKESLKQMLELQIRCQEIDKSAAKEKIAAMKRDKSFTLFSFLDRLAQDSNVKENVAYMKPFTKKSENNSAAFSNVKVKLDGIVIKQLLDFLYKIELSENLVYISSLSISKTGGDGKLSAVVETETKIEF